MSISVLYRRISRKVLLRIFARFPYLRIRIWALKKAGFLIGDRVYIPSSITITCNYADNDMILSLGDRVSLAPNVMLCLVSHPNYSKVRRLIKSNLRRIIIKDDAWIGAGAIILPDIEIGECSIVAAGSVVTHNVPAYTVVAGNPARVIKKIELH